MTAFVALFAASFLAATIVPFYSEFAVVGMIAAEQDAFWVLVTATLGNTLGAAVNWGIGRYLLHYRDRRWFPVSEHQLSRAQRWFQRYGVWSLLLAWLPIGGDALTFVAGIMRVRFPVFFVLTALGKGGRYAVLIYAAGKAAG